MLTKISLGKHSLTGISLGGVYTTLCVPELSSIFDIGIAPRSFTGPDYLFLSHAHADHIGALPSLIGVRGLAKQSAPKIYAPLEIVDDIREGLEAFCRGQRNKLPIEILACEPGSEHALHGDLFARAFRTLHSVPSLGYQLFRRVNKLRTEFLSLAGDEIAKRRHDGEVLFDQVERLEFAYATDTLIDVLDEQSSLYTSKTLVLECTFLDERKSVEEARQKSHIHLDEIIERAALFQNEHLVLMHFSQLYQPQEVHHILKSRLPERLQAMVRVFAPRNGAWPG